MIQKSVIILPLNTSARTKPVVPKETGKSGKVINLAVERQRIHRKTKGLEKP
ncbi:MAG: hypothetical protein MRY79_06935 [Alphaproteobacteria bacterium]|nr:hypothetical protein [Alphaproteobacteria bacterium]